MSPRKVVILLVLTPFVLFTLWVVATGGGMAEVAAAFVVNPWISQVTLDLVVALSMVCTWIWQDARRRGKNPLPWIVATTFTGSIAPLFYLLTRPEED